MGRRGDVRSNGSEEEEKHTPWGREGLSVSLLEGPKNVEFAFS